MENFSELAINTSIKKAIAEMGYEKPSQIQAQALPILLGEPTDFLGLAATGTGKTAAFTIPMLEKIDSTLKYVQALVLCPTRELALQVTGQINMLGKYLGIKAIPIYGGSSYGDQIHGLKSGAQIVVGTPGRLVDHIDRKTLNLSEIQIVVLDEADEMISMGFKEDLEKILDNTQEDVRSIWLFSATMDRGVRDVADSYLKNPKQVHINKKEMLSATVEQIYYMVHESDKPEIIRKLVDAAENFYGLVFCQTKSLVSDLAAYLHAQGYKVDSLHGDKDQNARERTLRAFREKRINILICTDVASRGIDVKDITHVINYSLPRELDNYVHRIGRTARSGKTGFAMSLVTPSHRVLVGRIEQMTKSKMTEGKIPTRKDIGFKKISKRLELFLAQNEFSKAIELLDQSWSDALNGMSSKEIAARFLTMSFPEIFNEKAEVVATMPGKPAQEGSARDRNRNERRRERRGGREEFRGDRRNENSRDNRSDNRSSFRERNSMQREREFGSNRPNNRPMNGFARGRDRSKNRSMNRYRDQIPQQ